MDPSFSPPSSRPSAGPGQPAAHGARPSTAAVGSGGAGDLALDMATLAVAGALVAVVLLVRRWLTLRARKPLPGLPRERVLPLSRHGTLHDPKYLGSILQLDDQEPPRASDLIPPAGPQSPASPDRRPDRR